MKSVVFSLLALSAPKAFARVPFSKPAILNIRGGVVGGDIITEVKEDFKGISIDPNMALGLSTAATVAYAIESSFPQYFSEKYTAAKKYEGNGEFWEGWFGVALMNNALLVAAAMTSDDDKVKEKMCLASALGWGVSVARSFMVKDDFDQEAFSVNQGLMTVLGLINLAGGGVFKFGKED